MNFIERDNLWGDKYKSIYLSSRVLNIFVYQKALIRPFHTNLNLCEFTALEHKFKRSFCTQKPSLNVCFKDLWFTKVNPTQLWYN